MKIWSIYIGQVDFEGLAEDSQSDLLMFCSGLFDKMVEIYITTV